MVRRRSLQLWLRAARPCALACVAALVLAANAAASDRMRTLSALENEVAKLEELVSDAHFRRAIQAAELTREWADEIPRSPAAKQARARLEVLLCTAQLALGERGAAQRSMGRAVYVWPLLQLDESNTSPRVVELFLAVRGGGASTRSSR